MTRQTKAITRAAYGGPEVLGFGVVDAPEPGEGELLVRVHAGSPNAADWHLLTGEPMLLRLDQGLRRPKHDRFGTDVAGVVEALGPGVTGFAVGDRVFGDTGGRGFAELTLLAADRAAHVPEGVTFADAATLPIAGVTALQAVHEIAEVGAGDRVLVNGASGGVGHFAVQIACVLGAEVTAVCSAGNYDLVARLGATHVIDYATTDYTATGARYDAIIDVVGNHPPGTNHRALTDHGRWVIVSGPKRRVLGPLPYVVRGLTRFAWGSRHATMFIAEETTARLTTLAEWLAAGEIEPVIERTYALPETSDAMRHIGTGRTRGKLVIEVTS